jgi:outer membrane immunogenic protein
MKKELLAATALTASTVGLGGEGAAAPLPLNWSGYYLGVGAGLAEVSDRVSTSTHGGAAFGSEWIIGSFVAGINRDVGNMVYGLEIDANFLGARQKGQTSGGADVDTTLDNLLTARARMGVKDGQALIFATGGLAAGNASLRTSYADCCKGASGSGSSLLLGWAAGGGVEYAATPTMSLNVTALYYALSSLSVNATGTMPYTATYTPEGWILRVGLNLHLR